MLKPIILAAVLTVVGGLSLQPALAQGPLQHGSAFDRTVQSDGSSAKRPQGEHVRVGLSEGTDVTASEADNSNVCAEAASGCSAEPDRDRNDVNRHDVGSPRSSKKSS